MKIGVDGGGTKTELILIDQNGEVVARHTAPGCNPSVIGPDNARDLLADALRVLLSQRSGTVSIESTLLCMAGSPGFWREIAATLTGYGRVKAATDALPVLELATSGCPGLVLHAGTGSFVTLRTSDGSVHYAGGLGWRIGDPGSAQDIGRRAIARALAELQGWAAPSPLSQALGEEFQATEPSAITAALHRDEEPNRRIGTFATRVSQIAAAGDSTAREIVLASTGELLACAEASARAHFGAQTLNTLAAGLSGPILTQPFVLNALQARATFPLKPLTEPPIEGVRRLLIRGS
jgi:N-acetylglucosamine kinase-like BadF-type ATPase